MRNTTESTTPEEKGISEEINLSAKGREKQGVRTTISIEERRRRKETTIGIRTLR